MTTADPLARSPLRTPRAWAALFIGVVLVGVGLGMMIDGGFGVAPPDALFTALSRVSGLTVGTILLLVSILMVLMSWALGLKPAIGTLISFVGIAVVVDLTRILLAVVDASEWVVGWRIVLWIVGLLLALVDLPDFVTPLRRIARASEKIAGEQNENKNDLP